MNGILGLQRQRRKLPAECEFHRPDIGGKFLGGQSFFTVEAVFDRTPTEAARGHCLDTSEAPSRAFSVEAPLLWNSLPREVGGACSLMALRKLVGASVL